MTREDTKRKQAEAAKKYLYMLWWVKSYQICH